MNLDPIFQIGKGSLTPENTSGKKIVLYKQAKDEKKRKIELPK